MRTQGLVNLFNNIDEKWKRIWRNSNKLGGYYETLATYLSCQWWRQKVLPSPATACERWSGIGCWEWDHRSTVGKHRHPGSLPASDHLQVNRKTKNDLQWLKFRSTIIKPKWVSIPLKLLFQINCIYGAHLVNFSHVLQRPEAWELLSPITLFQTWILSSFIEAIR